MIRFAEHHGAKASTIYGLAGMGDIVTTCYSPFGRNRSVGQALGKGQSLQDILKAMASVAEGVPTARSVHDLALQRGIPMPIATEVHRILFEGKPPIDAVKALLERDPKDEC